MKKGKGPGDYRGVAVRQNEACELASSPSRRVRVGLKLQEVASLMPPFQNFREKLGWSVRSSSRNQE